MTDPTPRPWVVSDHMDDDPATHLRIWSPQGSIENWPNVAVCYSDDDLPIQEMEANAEYIVRACNAFDDMKAALEDAQACIVAFRTGEWNDVRWLDQAAKSIHDALKKARES